MLASVLLSGSTGSGQDGRVNSVHSCQIGVDSLSTSPNLQAKLDRVAQERGTDAQALAREAIEPLVDYDDWFVRDVEKGLAQIDRGQTLSHDEVGARLKGSSLG